jgi:cytochrome c-type biogenesis protein CcmH
MMLWVLFALLTFSVIAILLVPLLKRSEGKLPARADYDIAVYRDQLKEIDQEIERGLLSETQADTARAEVHRRMLAAEDAELKAPIKTAPSDNRLSQLVVIVLIAAVVPLGAAILYSVLGSPQLPGEPYTWRIQNDPEFIVTAEAGKLEAQLQNNPSAAGYQHLAEMYSAARNYDQAIAADRRAISLGANDATTWSELGEAMVMINGGAVVPEALQAFITALGIDSRSERARFYIGLAEAQIGNLKQAVAIWRDLEKDSDPNAPWIPMLREHIKVFSKEGGFDPVTVPPSPPSTDNLNAAMKAMMNAMHAQAGVSVPITPPSSGNDQGIMIRGMVAQLAASMEKNPDDAAGWQRLAHAYNVLGEKEKARAAIDHALHLKPNDVDVQLILAEIQLASAAPGDDTPKDFIATMRTVLKLDSGNVLALYYVGLAEQKAGHSDQARTLWNKALSLTAANDPLAISIHHRLDIISGKTKAP